MTEKQAEEARILIVQIHSQRMTIGEIEGARNKCTVEETEIALARGMDGSGFVMTRSGRKQAQILLDKETATLNKLLKKLEAL